MGGNIRLLLKKCPVSMRPREKMLTQGEDSLTESELLAIILGMGTKDMTALQLADTLLVKYNNLRNIKEASIDELIKQKGIGLAKAVQIKAAFELGKKSGN